MAEIVGVAATAAQLAMMCFSLMESMRKIKGGSSTLEKYHHQLQELRNLSDTVSKNPLLQTVEVGLQTQNILSIIEDNCISAVLQKGRYMRTWALLSRERDILNLFASLERQKANLSLAIQETQSRALHQIQSDLKIMNENSSQSSNRSRDDQGTSDASPSASDKPSTYNKTYPPNSSATRHQMALVQVISQQEQAGAKSSPGPNTPDPEWEDCEAGPRIHQLNAPVLHVPPTMERQPLPPLNIFCRYNGMKKTGRGVQLNAPRWVQLGAGYKPDIPPFSGRWKNCTHVLDPDDGAEIQGYQINSPQVLYFDETSHAGYPL